MSTLYHKTAQAFSWSFLDAAVQRCVQLVIGVVLARLLFPEEFGLLGMLLVFTAVIQAFLDSGFGAALIQKPTVTEIEISSVFYFNLAMGLAGAGCLCLLAPWIAHFYGQPMLIPLARALSLTLVTNAFGMIQRTLLTKQINFKTQTKVNLISGAISGTIGVTLASMGWGVWSLVIQQVSASFLSTFSLWCLNPWRPSAAFSFKALGGMFGFGSRLLASSVLNQVFENIYYVVIGRLFSAADLGYFTRAKTLGDTPTSTLSWMIARVTFPVFATVQNDPARLKRGIRKILAILFLINCPMMIGLAVVARPLVVVLLTDKWTPCIVYLQLLCMYGLLYPLHLINLNVLQALGRSDLFLRLEVIKKIMIVVNIAVAYRWGISAIICGMVAMSIFSLYLNCYYTGILISYPLQEQFRDIAPYLVVSLLMAVSAYAIGLLPVTIYWLILVLQCTAGILVYCSLCWIFRLSAFLELLEIGRTQYQLITPRSLVNTAS